MTKSKKLTLDQAIKFMTDTHGVDYLTARNVLRGRKDIIESELQNLLQRRDKKRATPLPKIQASEPKKNDRLAANARRRSRQAYCEDPYSEAFSFVRNIEL